MMNACSAGNLLFWGQVQINNHLISENVRKQDDNF